MAKFTIASATMTIEDVVHESVDTTINSTTEAIEVLVMTGAGATQYAGNWNWSGTTNVLYDDTTATVGTSPNFKLWAPTAASIDLVITTDIGGTLTLSGESVITGTSVTFDMGTVPMTEVTFVANGPLSEILT